MLNDRLLQFVNIDLQEVKVLFFFFLIKSKYCKNFCLSCKLDMYGTDVRTDRLFYKSV